MSNLEVLEVLEVFSVCNVPPYKFLCNNRYRYSTLFELQNAVQFYPLSIYIFFFQKHFYTFPHPPPPPLKKKKKRKLKPTIKLNHNYTQRQKNFESCGNLIFQINNWDSNCYYGDYFVLSMLQPYTRKLLPFWGTAVVRQFMQENAFTL